MNDRPVVRYWQAEDGLSLSALIGDRAGDGLPSGRVLSASMAAARPTSFIRVIRGRFGTLRNIQGT